jgi:hypothetical protein
MEFFHKKTNFPFMATRKVWYSLSIVLMVVSFASFFARGLNFAIDFTGGISVEASFPKQVDTTAVRKAVVEAGFHDPQVKHIGSTRDVSVELQSTGQTSEQIRPLFQAALGKIDPERTMELLKAYRNPDSPRGPISIDPETRDIVQNEYLREVRKVNGQLANVELETVATAVKDPWKEAQKKK